MPTKAPLTPQTPYDQLPEWVSVKDAAAFMGTHKVHGDAQVHRLRWTPAR